MQYIVTVYRYIQLASWYRKILYNITCQVSDQTTIKVFTGKCMIVPPVVALQGGEPDEFEDSLGPGVVASYGL